jgi:hypothetical protein
MVKIAKTILISYFTATCFGSFLWTELLKMYLYTVDNVSVGFEILCYLLAPWSRVLLEKLTGLQLVKKFPAFYGTQGFIIAFTSARHLPLS